MPLPAALRRLLTRLELASNGHLTPVVVLLGALVIAVFVPCFMGSALRPPLASWLWCSRDLVLDGQVHRLLTAALAHEDPWHLVMNLLGLVFFGHTVERHLGSGRFSMLLLLAVLGSGLLHIAFVSVPFLGLSGAVFAILAAFVAIAPHARVVFFFFLIPAWLLISILVAINLLAAIAPQPSSMAWIVHLAGAAIGFAVIRWGRWPTLWLARWRSRRAGRRAEHDEAELDRILAKVSAEGLPALTGAERRFLRERSREAR